MIHPKDSGNSVTAAKVVVLEVLETLVVVSMERMELLVEIVVVSEEERAVETKNEGSQEVVVGNQLAKVDLVLREAWDTQTEE